MEGYLAPKQSVQVNKITSSCEICSGSHDTQYCIENLEQDFVEYTSSHNNEVGGKQFTINQGLRSFSEATNAWKDKPNFYWVRAQTFTSTQKGPFSTYSSIYQTKLERTLNGFDSRQERQLSSLGIQLGQQQDDVINKTNILWKAISKKFNDTPTRDATENSMAHMNVVSINHQKKEELRSKGIKSPLKLHSLKYLSWAYLEEQDMNPSSPKRVHFINSIVILNKESKAREEENVRPNTAMGKDHDVTIKANEEVEEESEEKFKEETKKEIK
nr:hypothetical protein [Tanacetum cinerariifolium]